MLELSISTPIILNQILENSKHIRKEKVLILGGGSNTLLLNDWDGIVLVPNLKSIINETQEYIDIKLKVERSGINL